MYDIYLYMHICRKLIFANDTQSHYLGFAQGIKQPRTGTARGPSAKSKLDQPPLRSKVWDALLLQDAQSKVTFHEFMQHKLVKSHMVDKLIYEHLSSFINYSH